MISEVEVAPGLVLHLDPDEFEAHTAVYSCAEEARVKGGHFFLCVAADECSGLWLPMFTNAGPGRFSVPVNGRTGHPKWTRGKFHFHRGQVWSGTHAAAVAAADAGGDMSAPGRRNRLSESSTRAVASALTWLSPDEASQL